MCGKFTQMLPWGELVELADLQRTFGATAKVAETPVTVTPMRFAAVIALDDDGRRKPVAMRWGLVPPGAKDPAAVKPHIHARAETVDTKPAFRDAFRRRRGIVAVTSFNEGREITPTKTEQHVLTPADGAPIGIAVIWEHGRSLRSFAMVTVPPNAIVATITDRMPALIDAADWPQWLGEVPASPAELKALLQPASRALVLQKAVKPPRKPDDKQPTLF